MEWFKDMESEDDLGLLTNELEELEDDEVSLREAAFINGYNRFDDKESVRDSSESEDNAEEEDYEEFGN